MNQTPIRKLLAFAVNAPYDDLCQVLEEVRKDFRSHELSDAVITIMNHDLVTKCTVTYEQAFNAKHVYESVLGVVEAVFWNVYAYTEWLQRVKAVGWGGANWREELITCFEYAQEDEMSSCGALAVAAEVMSSNGLPLPPDFESLQEEAHRRVAQEAIDKIVCAKIIHLMKLSHKLNDPEIMRDTRTLSPVY